MSVLLPGFDYAPALESREAVTLRERYGLFIAGEWTSAEGDAVATTLDPATENVLAHVACAQPADVDRAVRAARRGYEKYWRKIRPAERAKYAYRIARALAERAREFALVETLDSGKPIRESREFDVPQAAATLFYHAGWADKLEWALAGAQRPRPLGVAAAILSPHFPLLRAAMTLAPALACGNTVVLLPASSTPLSALLLAQICQESELPPGVVNVITGDRRTEGALIEHAELDRLSFSGTSEEGKAVRRATAGTRVRLALQLDGKSACIVYEDAPLDQAVDGIVTACYFNRGPAGGSASRVLVQESVYEEVAVRLRERVTGLRHGDPLDRNTDVGAIGSRERRDALAELVRGGVEEGATLVQAGCTFPERGFWFPATFFTNVQPTHRIAREPIFGPVLGIMTFRTPDEAIERANNVPYGLSAGVWTSSGALALYTAGRLNVGTVWC
ncbi:MAG: aldehyde dehydrogenase family protein, partial [Candidatus Baltobacteraceae bacterium]